MQWLEFESLGFGHAMFVQPLYYTKVRSLINLNEETMHVTAISVKIIMIMISSMI